MIGARGKLIIHENLGHQFDLYSINKTIKGLVLTMKVSYKLIKNPWNIRN